jgi:hypothetical protein
MNSLDTKTITITYRRPSVLPHISQAGVLTSIALLGSGDIKTAATIAAASLLVRGVDRLINTWNVEVPADSPKARGL